MAADVKGCRRCEGSTDDRQAMRDEDLWVTRHSGPENTGSCLEITTTQEGYNIYGEGSTGSRDSKLRGV